jgi:hypothetical protein
MAFSLEIKIIKVKVLLIVARMDFRRIETSLFFFFFSFLFNIF